MTILPIVYIPAPVLKMKAVAVDKLDENIKQLITDMIDTMYHYNGIGLAGNQVGVLQRVIVIDISDEDNGGNVIAMLNPEIISKSENENTYNEGCLSIPMAEGDVTRPESIEVDYLDADGIKQNLKAGGLLATCIQHEIDHLNGILFIDYLSSTKRDIIKRKVAKHIKTLDED